MGKIEIDLNAVVISMNFKTYTDIYRKGVEDGFILATDTSDLDQTLNENQIDDAEEAE